MANGTPEKYNTPTRGTTSSFLEKYLDKKADRDWIEAKLESASMQVNSLRSDINEAKKIAISARRRSEMPHDCSQKEMIEYTTSTIASWTKWWRGILVSALGFLVLVGGSWLYQYFTLSQEVKTTKAAITELKGSVKSIEVSQKELNDIVRESITKDDRNANRNMDEIRSALMEVLKEFKADSGSNKLDRRGS
jgi:hypothetical protein